MSTESTSDLLSIEDVAKELDVKPLAVLRLIARNVLRAGRLGDKGDKPVYRVQRADVTAYVAKNCRDLQMPEIEDGWIPLFWRAAPISTQKEMNALALENGQRWSEEQVAKWKGKAENRLENVLRVPLRKTTVISQVWASQPPGPLVRIRGKSADTSPLTTRGQEVLAEAFLRQLRRVVRKEPLRADSSAAPHLSRVYESPEAYEGFVNATVAQVLDDRTLVHPEAMTVGVMKHQITVQYAFPFSQLTTSIDLRKLAAVLL